MEKSDKTTVEQIPVTSTKQTTSSGRRVQQLTSTVEQPSLKTLDIHALRAQELFGYVTPWTRHWAKVFNHFHRYSGPLGTRALRGIESPNFTSATAQSTGNMLWWAESMATEGLMARRKDRSTLNPRRPIYKNEERFCPRCQELLSASAFGQDASRWDGVAVYCRECNRTRTAIQRDLKSAKERR